MGSKIEKKFELSKIILIIFSIVTIIAVFSTNFVFANNESGNSGDASGNISNSNSDDASSSTSDNTSGSTSSNKYSFKFDFGTGVSKDGNLTIKWNITTDGTVNYSSIIAISGVLQYDTYAFESPTMQGSNGFTATFNSENGKFVLDASSFKEGQQIATITLKAKSIPIDTNSEIGISNLQLANGDSDTEINKSYLKIGDIRVPANIYASNKTDDTIDDSPKYWENTAGDVKSGSDTSSNGNNGEVKDINNANGSNKSEYISPIEKDTTTSNKPIPQTGMKITIFVIMGVIVVMGIITFIRYKKFYD